MAPTELSAREKSLSSREKQAAKTDRFTLVLDNFEGPFDLLLSLIARRKLDITEVALAKVTDEFLDYVQFLSERGSGNTLDQISDFLVTAATLLDLKAARLLPQGAATEPEADTALLEARDLLFARLLQYRAYRDVAAELENRYTREAQRFPRTVLDTRFTRVLPELVFRTSAQDFARIAARVLSASATAPKPGGEAEIEHLQPPLTSIAEQEKMIYEQLVCSPEVSLAQLIAGAGEFEIAVVRFFALLELFRLGVVGMNQKNPLDEVLVFALDLAQYQRIDRESKTS